MTFAALLVTQKRDKGKEFLFFKKRLLIRHASRDTFSRRRRLFIRFFFCKSRRKRKSYQKENADGEISRSAERDKGSAPLMAPPFKKKAGENFNKRQAKF